MDIIIVVMLLVVVLFFIIFKKDFRIESFISNLNRQPMYLSGDEQTVNINDLREQLIDYRQRYDDTHQWLTTKLLKGDKHIDKLVPYSDANKYQPYLSNKDNNNEKAVIPKEYQQVYQTLPIWRDILNLQSPSEDELKQPYQSSNINQYSLIGKNFNLKGGKKDLINYSQSSDKSREVIPSKSLVEDIAIVQPCFFDKIEINNRDGALYYHDVRYPQEQTPVEFLRTPRKFAKKNPSVYPSYKYLSKF